MAPTPASLTIDFIANYSGGHRICYRIPPAVTYDCTTIVTCLGLGNPCQAIIPIIVDNESCDPVTYEGYVQAVCEAEGSLNGRIPFSITFTPVPTCASYRVTCNSVGMGNGVVIIAGTGYDPLNPPSVIPFGGGGVGASVSITVGSNVSITSPGAGYAPDGVYIAVPLVNISGTGTGAQATVTVFGGVVTAFVITTSGSGYFPGDDFTFNDSDLGGGGGAGFTGKFGVNYGTITNVTATAPGTGYTSLPGLTFPSPLLGVDATAVATLLDCVDQVLGLSCDGSPAQTITNMPLGQSAIECMQLPLPAIDPAYSFTPEACCYDCVSINMTVSALSPTSASLYYTDCTTHQIVFAKLNPGQSTGLVCAVNNSWYYSPSNAIVSVAVGAACP